MIHKHKLIIFESFIALFLLIVVFMDFVSAKQVISNLLLFLIFVELIRTITSYINEGVKLSIRFLIDGAFIFFIRELLFIFSNESYDFEKKLLYISLVIIIMLSLLVMRFIATKFSPIREKKSQN